MRRINGHLHSLRNVIIILTSEIGKRIMLNLMEYSSRITTKKKKEKRKVCKASLHPYVCNAYSLPICTEWEAKRLNLFFQLNVRPSSFALPVVDSLSDTRTQFAFALAIGSYQRYCAIHVYIYICHYNYTTDIFTFAPTVNCFPITWLYLELQRCRRSFAAYYSFITYDFLINRMQ